MGPHDYVIELPIIDQDKLRYLSDLMLNLEFGSPHSDESHRYVRCDHLLIPAFYLRDVDRTAIWLTSCYDVGVSSVYCHAPSSHQFLNKHLLLVNPLT